MLTIVLIAIALAIVPDDASVLIICAAVAAALTADLIVYGLLCAAIDAYREWRIERDVAYKLDCMLYIAKHSRLPREREQFARAAESLQRELTLQRIATRTRQAD
jgi:hypothetical protein